jgi:hypothetical protein
MSQQEIDSADDLVRRFIRNVSLRQHLLQLQDQSVVPGGEPMSAATSTLSSPAGGVRGT